MNQKKLLKLLHKALRARKGKFQKIAKRSGFSYSAITHIAIGKYPHNPGYTRVLKLFDALARS